MGFLRQLISFNEREVARYRRMAEKINALESQMRALPDRALSAMTLQFRERLSRGETLDDILPEAYAVAREAARRVLGERPFDVQLIGAIALHEGRIAEMKTGEGKTLTATLPLYLNALAGQGAHLVTTNDYLVHWQAEWMGQLYQFLGLTVGFIQHDMPPRVRREMYAADVTYVQNSELGFDYLRDNMALDREQLVQRDLNYAIVDEVDSILIDEARTPLILSGASADSTDLYIRVNEVVSRLTPGYRDEDKTEHGDYIVDEKMHTVHLTEAGQAKVEQQLGIANIADQAALEIQHHVQAALKARALFHRDKEYIVKDGEVIIVDEFTGHLQPGRRYSDGIHQAIEAKEGVPIRQEQQTVATITYQNFFRLYKKLAGMTGTAKTEEAEFQRIYNMPVIAVPTNRPVVRIDYPDVVYKTQEAKFRGIVVDIVRSKTRGQPVLVGTRNVEVSELIARRLLSDRVQLLALTAVVQDELFARKDLDREWREEWIQTLRLPLDEQLPTGTEEFRYEEGGEDEAPQERKKARKTLALAQVQKIARELGLNADPVHPTNLDRLLTLWKIAPADASAEERSRLAARLAEVLQDDKAINPLNAKFHAQEADVIREAGRMGMVTIATNMAGRGVDIRLGGAPLPGEDRSEQYEEVKRLGGLHVVGTERHESRRIDNQLRGRAGRQGDPGSSRFYVSLEDELMRIFAPERMRFLTSGWPEEEPVETRFISKTIERAQHKVEMRNFGIRKHTLNYDNVMNEQRSVIYSNRRRVLMGEDVRDSILGMVARVLRSIITSYAHAENEDELDFEGLCSELRDAVPGLMERLAIEAVMTELTDAFPQHLAAAAADQVAEDRQWAHRLLERAAREAAKSCDGSPNGLRELAAQLSNLAPGGQPIVPEALAGEEQLEEVAMRQMREALRLAEETNKDTVDEVLRDIQRLPISPSEDPKEGRLPNLEPAIREAAERLRGIRVQQLVEFREHLNGTALPPEYRASLVKACEERLHGVQRNGLAERLAVEALSRTVTHILTVRAKQLYEEEQQWHVRALERRIEEAIRLNAYPDAELAEWDLEALTRDADQIVPGTATVITQHGDTVEAHEFPEFIRQTALALASQPDPEQIAPRLETLEERVASAVRSALPEQPNLGEVGLEALLQKAGEAEGEMRSLLAQEAARRVRASRLRSELKEPAGQMYAQRAQAVQSAWGLWRAFAISTLRKLPPSDMLEEVKQRAIALYRAREKRLGENAMRHLERSALLNAIEASWPQHLQDMDHLREAVYLRAYGQLDPLVQYQKESFEYFQRLLDRIAQDVTKLVFGADFVARPVQRRVRLHEEAMRSEQGRPSKPLPSSLREVKRERPAQLPAPNKRCWCGSGRKYKNCHMAQDEAELTTSSARN